MGWSDEFAVGIKRIDAQHKRIFTMAEGFRAALDEGGGERVCDEVLQALHLYARAHFRFEERHMSKYHHPLTQRNKKAHVGFVAVLSKFQQRYAVRGFDRADARHLMDTIDQWLAGHICRIDGHLKQYVEEP